VPPRRRARILRVTLFVALLAGLTALWQWGPAADLLDPSAWADWQRQLRGHWYAYFGGIAAYVGLGLLLAPHTALIVVTALVLGPIAGLIVSFVGGMLSAAANYGVGARLGHRDVLDIAGGRVHRLSVALGERGIEAVVLARLLPIAPFAMVSYGAGASHIRFRDFMIGTLIGIVPGTIGVTLLADQFGRTLREPTATNLLLQIALAAVVGTIAVLGITWLRSYLRRRHAELDPE
jgi:phospholipase D1/2